MHEAQPSFRRGPRAVAVLVAALLGLTLALVPGFAGADDANPNPGSGTAKNSKGEASWGMGPAKHVPEKQVVDGRAYLVYSANPGATILDQIKIFNYGTRPLTLQVYPTDAVQSDTGAFGLLPGGDAPADAGTWIKLRDMPKNGKITVPGRVGKQAYNTKLVKFIARIPLKATPGDHVAGIVASLKVTSRNKKGAKITLDQRVGVRAYFTLSGKLAPKVTIENLKASYGANWDPRGRGDYTVSYVVHNTGNLRLNVAQDVTVNRCVLKPLCPAGKLVAHPAGLRDLLPGSKVTVTQRFDKRFGLGHPSVDVTLHPSPVDTSLQIKKIADVSASVGFWAWPWLLIVIIVAILLLIAFAGWRIDRRRRERARVRAEIAAAPAPRHAAPLAREARRLVRLAAGMLAVAFLAAPVVLPSMAEAKAPDGSLAEVILETKDVTGQPFHASLDGWWGHEGGKQDAGLRPTYLSLDASDGKGVVDDATIAAVHKALDDGGSFDSLRVAFVPYSADGSNERPKVSKGESAGEAFEWFSDLGFGGALNGKRGKNDFVNWVSTADEYSKWWKAGRPVQAFTPQLKVVDVSNGGSSHSAAAPQGRSILNRWPAGTKISLVFYVSDGFAKDMPQVPTVKVGPDGRALTAWLTFETTASPTDPARTSAGYRVLTGAGTGPEAARPKSTSNGQDSGQTSNGQNGDAGSTSGTAGSSDGSGSGSGDDGGLDKLASALPGGRPTFYGLAGLVVLGAAAWITARMRSDVTSAD